MISVDDISEIQQSIETKLTEYHNYITELVTAPKQTDFNRFPWQSQDDLKNHNDDQRSVVQLSMQKEILEAQNKALSQQLARYQQDNKQYEKALRSLQDQLTSSTAELQRMKDHHHHSSSPSSYTSSDKTLPLHRASDEDYPLLKKQSDLMQNYLNELEELFYQNEGDHNNQNNNNNNSKMKNIYNSLVLEADYQTKVELVVSLQKEKKDLQRQVSLFHQKMQEWKEERETLLANIEAASLTEQAIYTANLKKAEVLQELQKKYHDLEQFLTKEQENNVSLAKRLDVATSNSQAMEKELKRAVLEVKNSLEREKNLGERIRSLEEKTEQISKEQTTATPTALPRHGEQHATNVRSGGTVSLLEKNEIAQAAATTAMDSSVDSAEGNYTQHSIVNSKPPPSPAEKHKSFLQVLQAINQRKRADPSEAARDGDSLASSLSTIKAGDRSLDAGVQPSKRMKLVGSGIPDEISAAEVGTSVGKVCNHCQKSPIGIMIKCRQCQRSYHRHCWNQASFQSIDSIAKNETAAICKHCSADFE